MYKFIDNICEKDYKDFYKKNSTSFMQSYEWGQFNKVSRNQKPHYLGVIDEENNILCEALILEKKGPFNLSYFYSPRGFIIDFNDKKLLEFFINNLIKFTKKNNGIYLKVDPEIELRKIDNDGNPIEGQDLSFNIFNNLIDLEFKHTGFIKNFENNQPRYSFRIDLTKDIDEIKKNIHKSVLKKIKKTYEYNMQFRESNDTNKFYDLLLKTSEKDNFLPYSRNYYKEAKRILKDTYKLFEVYINPKELYSKIQETLKKLEEQSETNNNLVKSIERRKKEILELEKYKDSTELVLCSQMCAMTKDGVWTLYIGNDEIGKNLYAVNRMYYEIIQYSKNTSHKYLDLFGTTGDPINAPKNLAGIHNYKKNYGGEYIEFIGEFDYVNKKLLYKILPIFLKLYRKILKKKSRKS